MASTVIEIELFMILHISVLGRVKKAKIRNDLYYQVPQLTETLYGKVTKTQRKITHKRAKRSALSQQVITRLQGTIKTNV